MRQREIDSLIKLYKNCIKKLDEMDIKYAKKVEKDLKEVGKKVIDDWYSDYIPNLYRREYSLYKAFRVQVKNGKFSVSFSPYYMRAYHHRVENDYIFDNSFLDGWHGGADKGKGHPFPGYPMYREPNPYYTNWYFIAERSFSPYEKIYDEMNKKIDEINEEYNAEFKKEILDKIDQKLSHMKGGT